MFRTYHAILACHIDNSLELRATSNIQITVLKTEDQRFDTGCIDVQEVSEKNLGLELQLVTSICHGDGGPVRPDEDRGLFAITVQQNPIYKKNHL